MTTITLTDDQQNALDQFIKFLTDPHWPVFVLKGYSGTGKSTLVQTILDRYQSIINTAKLIDPSYKNEYELVLTATTNKAAETLSNITGMSAQTIHSFLQLRVQTDYKTGDTHLTTKAKTLEESKLLFIDEASYIDKNLLKWIFNRTNNCKIVFIGDPAQLTPVKYSHTPVFEANFPGVQLSKVVRQAEGNPIVELSTLMRNWVETGEPPAPFVPDGNHVQVVDRDTFNQLAVTEMTRADWAHNDSKILAWTNNRVKEYNQYIRDQVKGDPQLHPGDYAINNHFLALKGNSIKTDYVVRIEAINPATQYGVPGKEYKLEGYGWVFMPDDKEATKARLKQARDESDYSVMQNIQDTWADLRAAYACTINKAQGSTYDRVFIDLDDIGKCRQAGQIARMLYVGISRARHQVILTGDI